MWPVRHGILVLALIGALVPLGAYADDGNQAAIDAARADQQWLTTLSTPQQGVVLGQREMQNARAIAQLLSWDAHAQSGIPNTTEQYRIFCANAVALADANVANGRAIAAARPWDPHAQAEAANAEAIRQTLWGMIGDSFPGNPYLVRPAQGPVVADDGDQAAVADTDAVASDEDAASGSD
jgi:hypothetical protein